MCSMMEIPIVGDGLCIGCGEGGGELMGGGWGWKGLVGGWEMVMEVVMVGLVVGLFGGCQLTQKIYSGHFNKAHTLTN